MIGTKAVETIDIGAAFSRKTNATSKAYRAREAVVASRSANHCSILGTERPPTSGRQLADGAPRAEQACGQARTLDSSERASMLRAIPALRAFAVSLTGSTDAADDLVQETLVRAMAHIGTFERGTNMDAWLFTILRNLVYSQSRKKRRDAAYRSMCRQQSWKTHPEQPGKIELMQMRQALMQLPAEQREAVILIGASGLSYEEAAAVIRCAVGTVKSRVSRARERLATLLDADAPDHFGPDRQELAVVA
jgi:RNA polymerase sigma-70 factor (ECF subfamily)